MVGKKFTWTVKSRIDRILVSREWLEFRPNCKQNVFSRPVFDHFVLVLKDTSID